MAVTGVFAMICRHGLFLKNSWVDFVKGERLVLCPGTLQTFIIFSQVPHRRCSSSTTTAEHMEYWIEKDFAFLRYRMQIQDQSISKSQ